MNWKKVRKFEEILYEKCDGVAKVTINRPHRRNSFTPDTVAEMIEAFSDAKDDTTIGVVLLTGFNPQTCLLYTSPSPRDGLLSRMPSSA